MVESLYSLLGVDDDRSARRFLGLGKQQGKSANGQSCEAESAVDDRVGDSARVRLAYWPVVSVVETDVFQLDVASLKIN